MALTGKFRFRKTLWGKIVLQFEEEVKPFWGRHKPGPLKPRWRDATLMDLAAPEVRPLIDMRFRPQFRFQSSYALETTFAQRERNEVPAEIGATAPRPNSEVRRAVH